MFLVNQHRQNIQHLCETHHVETLYLFGSANTSKFNDKSDIDFLVKFKSFDLKLYFLNYNDFKNKLNRLLKREIDLVEEQTLKNPYLINSINENKELHEEKWGGREWLIDTNLIELKMRQAPFGLTLTITHFPLEYFDQKQD